MAAEQSRARALALIEQRPAAPGGGVVEWLTRLCQAVSVEAGTTAATITMGNPADASAVITASDPVARQWAETEFGVGEGPAHSAWTHGRPVLIDELGGPHDGAWPGYANASIPAGLRAVFAFPLRVGAARVGVLTLFRDSTGALAGPALNMCLTMAELATEKLLHADDGRDDAALHQELDNVLSIRSEVYQAQGMVAVALGIGLGDALARLRGEAFHSNRELVDVAIDIVHNGLSLEDDAGPGQADTVQDEED